MENIAKRIGGERERESKSREYKTGPFRENTKWKQQKSQDWNFTRKRERKNSERINGVVALAVAAIGTPCFK